MEKPQDQLTGLDTQHLWVTMSDVERVLKQTSTRGQSGKSLLYQRLRGIAREQGIDRKFGELPFDTSFLKSLETIIGADPEECTKLSIANRMEFVLSRVTELRNHSIKLITQTSESRSRPKIRIFPDDMHLAVRAVLEGLGKRTIDMPLQEKVSINQSLQLNGFEPLNEVLLNG